MEILPEGSKLRSCPCYQGCQEFQKLVELKACGLVIYCHRSGTENISQGEAVASAVSSSTDVFILHNKKDVKVTTSQLTSELEKENISCPRCKKRFQHVQELMKEMKSLDRRIVMGICDHCRKRARFRKKTFCVCEKIVKQFKTVKGEQTEDTINNETILPSKTGHLRKETQKKSSAYSGLQITPDIKPTAGHELEVEQMFYSNTYFQSDDTEMSESDSKEDYLKRSINFIEPDGKKINIEIPGIALIGSVPTFMEPYNVGVKELPRPSIKDREQKEVFEDMPSIIAKEELKRRHDFSLRQMLKHEKDSGVSISMSKRPDVYETPKAVPWEKKQPKYDVDSETEIKNIPTITKHKLGPSKPDDVSNKLSTLGSPRKKSNMLDADIEPSKLEKKRRDKVQKGSEERAKNVKKLEEPYFVTNIKLGRNINKVKKREMKSNSKRKSEGNVRNAQFSYVFPKKKEKKAKQINVKSSALIRDTHEKYKKRKEQERQAIQEQREKKQLGREARKQDVEKNIYMDDQQMLLQRDKSKEISVGNEIRKKDKKSKSGQKVTDAVEEESRSELKVESVEKEEKRITVEKGPLKAEKRDKLKSKKGERDDKVQSDKQIGQEILKEKIRSKNVQTGKDDLKEEKIRNKNVQTGKDELIEEKLRKKSVQTGKDELIEEKLRKKNVQTGKDDLKEEKLRKKDMETGKDVLKEEKGSKEKIASPKKGMSIKKKLESSDDIKTSSSNIDKKGEKIATKTETPNDRKELEELKRLKAEHLKEKAEALKKKLLLDSQKEKQNTEPKELKMKSKPIKQARSYDYLKLVKIKQAAKIKPSDVNNELLTAHITQHNYGQKISFCPLCLDSELEFEVLSLNNERNLKKDDIQKIIIGEKIYRYKPGLEKIKDSEGVVPILFKKEALESEIQSNVQIIPKEIQEVVPIVRKNKLATGVSKKDEVDTEDSGVIRYALSDRKFIDKGWTVLPTEKVVRMMNVYRMHPAHPEFDWFKHNKNKGLMTYDTGERLAEFDDNGRGRWYYRNGRLALDYYDAEETNAQQRFVIYSSGEPDERGRTHPITILATFDYLGNGIVFDHAGKIRLKYNQTEGVVLDRTIGPVSHWKWHTLNDPPVLQQVMIDTQLPHKDPDILKLGSSSTDVTNRPDNEEMLAIEFDNFIKEKTRKLSQKLVPFQIKMKALKINQYFSLKVLDQATVYLIFRDGLTNLKVNMGMILDEKEIVDTDTAEVGEVSNNLERFPARTDSLAGLQRSVAHAQRYERQRAERERRLRPPEPCASADIMTAAASRPMRLPFRTVPTESSSTTQYYTRKPSNNLYYDTRLLC